MSRRNLNKNVTNPCKNRTKSTPGRAHLDKYSIEYSRIKHRQSMFLPVEHPPIPPKVRNSRDGGAVPPRSIDPPGRRFAGFQRPT